MCRNGFKNGKSVGWGMCVCVCGKAGVPILKQIQHDKQYCSLPQLLHQRVDQRTPLCPPLVSISRSYILWSKFQISHPFGPFNADTGGDANWSENRLRKRKAYIRLKGTHGTRTQRYTRKKNGGGAEEEAAVDKSLPSCRFTVLEWEDKCVKRVCVRTCGAGHTLTLVSNWTLL